MPDEREDAQALVLDRVAEGVDGVVVGDDPVGVVEVAVEERLGARRDRVEGQRSEAHDVERARRRPRDGHADRNGSGTTSEETTLRSWCGPRERSAPLDSLFPLCSPPRHHAGHGASTPSPYAPRRQSPNQSTFQEEHPHAPFVRSSRRHRARRAGAAGAADRQRGASAAPPTDKLAVGDAQRRRVDLPARASTRW